MEYIVSTDDTEESWYAFEMGRYDELRELIRCKDCKYYLKSNEECELISTRLHFYEENKKWTEDSSCLWAERKEE